MFISHRHESDDGFTNLEEGSGWFEDDSASLASVVHRSEGRDNLKTAAAPIFRYEVSQHGEFV